MAEDPQATTPNLKISGLHIAGYRSIHRLDLPDDGIGWAGEVPDIMLVGGANGSGKTTLLEGIFRTFSRLDSYPDISRSSELPDGAELRLDLRTRLPGQDEQTLVVALGRPEYLDRQMSPVCLKMSAPGRGFLPPAEWLEFLGARNKPHIVYFPTDRLLNFPVATEKSIDPPVELDGMTWRFKPAETYKESLVNQLTWARFEDLNDKEDGHKESATRFEAYIDAFHRFVDSSKVIVWHNSRLRVRTQDGSLHGLPELSSGEKQALLFATELRLRWTPGALVLIDEPELHLHEAWQSTLFEMIRDLQRERGGQAILTTQSGHLFSLGEPGSKVVLHKGWP